MRNLPWRQRREAGSDDDRALIHDILTEQVSGESLSAPCNDVFSLGADAEQASHSESLFTELGVDDYSFLRRLHVASHGTGERRAHAFACLAEWSAITPEEAFGLLHHALSTADVRVMEGRIAESVCVIEHF